MANTNPTHVVTGKVRLSYAHLFQPYAQRQDQEAKFSTTVLVPKTDAQTKALIDAAIEAAKQAGAAKWGGTIPPILAICVHDGDGPRPSDGMPFGTECHGHWVFTASSKQRPKVVDLNVQPILDAGEVYSGCYAHVSVDFFPYNSNGKKGIGCGLQNVQKVADGDPLGNRTSAEDDFGAPQAAPAAYQQPAGYAAPAGNPAAPNPYQAPAAATAANPYAVPNPNPYQVPGT